MKNAAYAAVGVILILALVFLSPLPAATTPAQTPQAQNSSPASYVPQGMPTLPTLNSTGYFLAGYFLANLIEQTPQFRALAGGTTFSIRPYQSFGYEGGATIPSEEIIMLFSPNGLATIEVDVITAPAPGTTSVNSSQIAYIHQWPAVNSTSTISLLLDLSLDLHGSWSPGLAPSFTPIVVSMALGNSTGDQLSWG